MKGEDQGTDLDNSNYLKGHQNDMKLPSPIQPSLLYMTASLPRTLHSVCLPKLKELPVDPRLKTILSSPPYLHHLHRHNQQQQQQQQQQIAIKEEEEEKEKSELLLQQRQQKEGLHYYNSIEEREPDYHQLLQKNEKETFHHNNKSYIKKKNSIPLLLLEHVEEDDHAKRASSTSSISSSSTVTSENSRKYNCPICQKKFMRPSSLKIHTYSHTGEKPYQCTFSGCERRFSVHSNMKRHLRVHPPLDLIIANNN